MSWHLAVNRRQSLEKKENTTLISLALSGSSLPKSRRQAEIRVG